MPAPFTSFNHRDNVVNLIIAEEVRNLSGCQQVVHHDKELFISNLSVAHQEDSAQVLEAGLVVEPRQVLLQVRGAVALAEGDLEDLHGRDVGGEAGE
jgi:hypothetical protein